MKETIFRGKRIDNNEWVKGNLINWNNKLNPRIIWFTLEGESIFEASERELNYEVFKDSVGQYTGLKDEQGKGNQIYEDDYFEIHGVKWFVEWQDDLCRFVLTTGHGYDSKNCIDLTCDEVYYLKIKGNKHD